MSRVVDDPGLRERVRVFEDRFHAGRVLAEMLREHVPLKNSILLAVPAGGVPVGYEVSTRLSLQMDLIIVRKLQIPWDPEAGFGAISWDGELVLNEELVRRLELTQNTIQESAEKAMESIRARIKRFRKGSKGSRSRSGVKGFRSEIRGPGQRFRPEVTRVGSADHRVRGRVTPGSVRFRPAVRFDQTGQRFIWRPGLSFGPVQADFGRFVAGSDRFPRFFDVPDPIAGSVCGDLVRFLTVRFILLL